MSEKVQTFGKVYVETDKMAGLRISTRDETHLNQTLLVQGWDEKNVPEIKGRLINADNAIVWEGVLMTRQRISEIFQPFEKDESPITYARRSGKLGKPKTVGVIRLETKDAMEFCLMLCDGGEQPIEKLASTRHPTHLTLEIETTTGKIQKVLFGTEQHAKKIAKTFSEAKVTHLRNWIAVRFPPYPDNESKQFCENVLGYKCEEPPYSKTPFPLPDYIPTDHLRLLAERLQKSLTKAFYIHDRFGKNHYSRREENKKHPRIYPFIREHSKLRRAHSRNRFEAMIHITNFVEINFPDKHKQLTEIFDKESYRTKLDEYNEMEVEDKIAFVKHIDTVIYKFLEALSN